MKKTYISLILLSLTLTLSGFSCSSDEDNISGNVEHCDGKVDTDCIEIHNGESIHYKKISLLPTVEIVHDGETLTVVPYAEIITSDLISDPENFRYQIYGTDDYTFGGYATWYNMENGYLEVTTRRTIFDESQNLDASFRVKFSYKILISPGK
jgi:hypothetical protein